MTIKQIAEIANVSESTVRNWIKTASAKTAGLSAKTADAQEGKEPALFTLPETIAIIRAGGRETLADLLLSNAKTAPAPVLEAPTAQPVTLPLSALTDMIAVSVVKALRPEIAKAVRKASVPADPTNKALPAPEGSENEIVKPHPKTPDQFTLQIDLPCLLPKEKASYLTSLAFAENHKIPLTRKAALVIGQKASALMRKKGDEPFHVKDFRYGYVNAYPEEILIEVFKQYYGGYIK